MKGHGYIIGFFAALTLGAAGIVSCDTASNVENPDLHYFMKYYGGDGDQQAVDMALLDDGSFLLLGNYIESPGEKEIYLTRVDAEGKMIWEKRLGLEEQDNVVDAKDLEPTADGNFVILADFRTTFGNVSDLKLLKVSPDGMPLDSVRFSSPLAANDFGRTVTLLDDGGFLVSGTTEFTSTYATKNNPDPDLGDLFNYRFDQNLDIDPVWGPVIKGYGSHFDVAVRAVQRDASVMANDTSFCYVFGYTNSNISGQNPDGKLGLFYFGLQSSGSLNSGVFFPGNIVKVNDTEIQFVERLAPGLGTGFLVVGTSQTTIGVSEIFLARMRNSLTFKIPLTNDAVLYTTIPLSRNVRGVSATSSLFGMPGYLVLGNEIRNPGAPNTSSNIWLSKIDQSGSVLWSSTFGSEAEDDRGAAVLELPDGKIVILGTAGLADSQSKMALIKVNPDGRLLK